MRNTQLTSTEIEELVRDFRSARMDSLEGGSRARRRLDDFYELGPGPELAMELNRAEGHTSLPDPDDEPVLGGEEAEALESYREVAAKAALEEADLIGFWVAWHRAGGFRGLENAGWHRTTIHRRVKRFRLRFGVHPDEMTFSWISLDVERCWVEEYERLIRQANALLDAADEDD
jgi:hypothetical protein